MTLQAKLTFETLGRGTLDITRDLEVFVHDAGVALGTCHVFLQHTSASLFITENADPDVRRDLEAWLERQVRDGDALYRHTCEGPDDMPAHVRAALLGSSVMLPIMGGRLALGTWQGVFLYEHRLRPHRREVIATVTGCGA